MKIKNKTTPNMKIMSRILLLTIALFMPFITSLEVYAKEQEPTTIDMFNKGIYYYDPYTDKCELNSDDNSDSQTETSSIYVVGDSITVGMESVLKSKLESSGIINSNIKLNGEVARSVSGEGDKGTSGLDALKEDEEFIKKASAVVVELGTNGGNSKNDIKKMTSAIKKINKDTRIYWVNIGHTNKSQENLMNQSNDTLNDLSDDQGYKIIDWNKAVEKDSKLTETPDGSPPNIHPNNNGYKVLSNMIATSIEGVSATQSSTNDSSSSNKSNPRQVWDFLVSQNGLDLSPVQAAAVMGNIQQEANFDPKAGEHGIYGSSDPHILNTGFGLIQWTNTQGDTQGRRYKAITWMKKNDYGIFSMKGQLEYFKEELKTGYKSTYEKLKKQNDLIEATVVFHDGFEGSADSDEYVRNVRGGTFAKKWLTKFGDIVGEYNEPSIKECGDGNDNPAPTIDGLESPPGIKELSMGYFRLPEAKYFDFSGGADVHCGSKALVDVIYTVAKAWESKYPKNKLIVGDLNAAYGHASHKNGVDVDITTVGMVAANVSGDREKSKELGKLFADTGAINLIFYNDSIVQNDFNDYAKKNKLPGNMQSWPNHDNHFHVRVLDKYSLKESLGCPSN